MSEGRRPVKPLQRLPLVNKMNRAFVLFLFGLASCLGSLGGCGSSPSPTELTQDEAQLKVLGILYGKFMRNHRGRGPKDRQEFLEYLRTTPRSWEKMADSAEQFTVSTRDGQPVVLLLGDVSKYQDDRGDIWVGYEAEGVDSQRKIFSIRGRVREIDEQELENYFPSS